MARQICNLRAAIFRPLVSGSKKGGLGLNQNTADQKRKLLIATIFTFVFMAGYALSSGILGTLMPRIIEYYNLSLSAASTINIAKEGGNTASMIFALLVVDRLDKSRLLLVMGLSFGAALLLFGFAPAFAVLLLIQLVIGFSGGLLDNLCATYVSDLYGERRARFVSILHTLYAVGNMVGPKFASWSYSVGGWTLSFLTSGAALVLAGVLYFLLTKMVGAPATAVGGSESTAARAIPYGQILRSKNLWWLSVVSLAFASTTYLIVWLPTYLDWLNPAVYTTDFCANVMTAFSFGMLISRTGLAALSGKMRTETYAKWSCLFSAILFAAMLVVQQPLFWLGGMFLFGVISGASYTARFVLSCQEFPEYSATASAFTGVFGALGNVLYSAGIGALADAGYYTQAHYSIVAALLIGFLVFTFCYRAPGREKTAG